MISPSVRAYIAKHIVTFLTVSALVVGPLIGGYVWLYGQIQESIKNREEISKDRADFAEKKATALIEIEKARLDVEKVRNEVAVTIDKAKALMEETEKKANQVAVDGERMKESWKNIQAWQQKLSPEEDFKQLVNEFTQLSVDFNHCYEAKDRERYVRAELLAQRIWYAAYQTKSQQNLEFAKRIQPMAKIFGCPTLNRG